MLHDADSSGRISTGENASSPRRPPEESAIRDATPAAIITANAAFRAGYPGVVEGVALIGSDQVQNRATPDGSLCNASPAADSGPPMVVNGARAIIASPDGERLIPISELAIGPVHRFASW